MPYHVVVKKGATIPDTLKLINLAVNVYYKSPFVTRLTKQLNPNGDKYDFCKRLFDYVCKNVKYQLDGEGNEEVWSPEKTIREGRGDCKKMTTLIACVLKNAGIEPVLKHVRYKDEAHTHIYVIVPFPTVEKYLTIDPVNHCQWNTEVEHAKASLYFLNGEKMDLHMMGNVPSQKKTYTFKSANLSTPICGVDDDISALAGVGCACSGVKDDVLSNALAGDFNITGLDDDQIIYGVGTIGRKRRSKAEKRQLRKDRRQKAFKVFKAVNLAPIRASFLMLVRSNIFRLANRMAKAWIHDSSGLTKMWLSFGGDPKVLKNTIKKGAWKSIRSKINGVGELPSVMELEAMETQGIGVAPAIMEALSVEGIGVAPAVAAAAIAAATPILLATIKIIGKSKHDQDSSADSGEEEESNADIMSKGIQEGAQNYAQATEGIGYADEVDEIVSGEDYDYIDGMGRKRKKDKGGRKAKKAAKKEKKAARKARKKGGADSGDYSTEDLREDAIEEAKSRARLDDSDVKALSTLAEYGTRKLLKGKVTAREINQIPVPRDEGGTENTPLAPPPKDDASIPPENKPTAGSFGLTQINSITDLLHWFRGILIISIALGCGFGYTYSAALIGNAVAIISLVYLTRKHILRYHSLLIHKIFKTEKK